MTDDEITRLAQRSLRCYIAAFQSRDTTQLSQGNFSPLMRRGIERYIDQLPADALWSEDLDWTSYRLTDRKLFYDLRAYIHEVSTPERQRVQLTAFDQEGRVCEFASIGEFSAQKTLDMDRERMERISGQPWADQVSLHLAKRIPLERWFHLTGFSTRFKLDALLQVRAGLSCAGKTVPGEVASFEVNLPVGYSASLSEVSVQRLLDELVPVLINNVRMTFDNPSALHIFLVEAIGHFQTKDQWRADRLVVIADGQSN
jgi:hypothetical protein